MHTLKIISPTKIVVPRKTKADRVVSLNLNAYRNLHYQTNNQCKRIYTDILENSILKNLKLKTPISMEYQLYKGTKRTLDSMNIYSIVDKFFCDALVEMNCIEDDNDFYVGTKVFYPSIYSKGVDECIIKIHLNKLHLFIKEEDNNESKI